MVRMPSRLGELAILLGLVGCFSNAQDLDDCPIGAKACPCTPGGSCDDELECHAMSNVCFDPQCERGSETCECLDGQCVASLECRAGLCQMPAPEETSTSASDTGGGSGSTDPTSTSSTTADDTSGATTDEGGSTTMSTPDTCGECIDAAAREYCMVEYDACMQDPEEMWCWIGYECAIGMDASGLCCPTVDHESSTALYNDVLSCAASHCSRLCDVIPPCPGG